MTTTVHGLAELKALAGKDLDTTIRLDTSTTSIPTPCRRWSTSPSKGAAGANPAAVAQAVYRNLAPPS